MRSTWAGIGRVLGPLAAPDPAPARIAGGRRTCLRQARLLGSLRRESTSAARLGRGHACSPAASLTCWRGYFESDAMARPAVGLRGDRHLGRGPRLGRDRVRDAAPSHRREPTGRRVPGASRAGGMGGVSGAPGPGRPGCSARRSGPTPRWRRSRTSGRPGHRGHAGQRGGHRRAGGHHPRAHPQISFLRLARPRPNTAPRVRPPTSRGLAQAAAGTVKINLALDRLARCSPAIRSLTPQVYGRHRSCWRSRSTTSRTAFQQAVAGRAGPRLPFADICIPSVFRRLAGAGRESTSCRCSPSGCRPGTPNAPHEAELEGPTPTGCSPRVEKVAPRVQPRRCCNRQVIGPHRMQEEYGPGRAGTSSTGSCRWDRCSTPGRRPATPTCGRRCEGAVPGGFGRPRGAAG